MTPVSRAEGLGTAAEFVGTDIIDGVFRHCGGAVIVASEQEDAMDDGVTIDGGDVYALDRRLPPTRVLRVLYATQLAYTNCSLCAPKRAFLP